MPSESTSPPTPTSTSLSPYFDRAVHLASKLAQGGGRSLPLTGRPGQGAEAEAYAGPLHSKIAGRTDRIKLDVKPGSYVVPADVVSILGEGNTLHGTTILKAMFDQKMLAGSVPPPRASGRRPRGRLAARPLPHGQHMRGMHSQGGRTNVPIIAAGGEHVIEPEAIEAKFGDLDHGHDILDEFVKAVRAEEIGRLKKAPPPKQ